jgi:hypothetical protein
MTSEERKKILEMLASGKITADEADKLLERLSAQPSQEAKPEDASASSAKPRFLRILIERPNQDHVNVRVPLGFMRTGTNLLAVLPTRVREKLAEQGIDVAALGSCNEKEWASVLESMPIDIEKANGKKVKIFCE